MSALVGGELSASSSGCLTPEERALGSYLIRVWMMAVAAVIIIIIIIIIIIFISSNVIIIIHFLQVLIINYHW